MRIEINMKMRIFAILNQKLPAATGKCLAAFLFVVLSSIQVEAQSTKLQMHDLAPDWNQKEVCDNGNGYRPETINTPTFNLSFNASKHNLKDARYEYVWEAKVNDEPWKAVQSGKDVVAIPSCRPATLFNKANGAPPMKCYWRLRARDIANDSDWAESTEFSLTLASVLQVTYTTQADNNNIGKTTVDLRVNGGFLVKTFEWEAVNTNHKIPEGQNQVEDPKGLIPGQYRVTVSDGCSKKALLIDTQILSQ